jgi:lambda repressor-like predicted transcriptional regulator
MLDADKFRIIAERQGGALFASCVSPSRSFARMQNRRDEQAAWIRAVQAHLGVSLTELARRAKIAPSTLQRPINDPQWDGLLSDRTLAAVAEVAGLRPFEFPARQTGFGEVEAVPFQFDPKADAIDGNIDRAVRELTRGRNGRDAWVIQSDALERSGLLPGDIVIVDLNIQPKARDIVCAQLYDWSRSKAETVFRLYEPPYLLTDSLRARPQKPVPVDGQDVVIRGVVDGLLRRRPG